MFTSAAPRWYASAVRLVAAVLLTATATSRLHAQSSLEGLSLLKDFSAERVGSHDPTGGNADYLRIEPGTTVVLGEITGPAAITHMWFTIDSSEAFHLKKLILRIYWDGETTPSVEAPIGDFVGLGLGEYVQWASAPMNVSPVRSLNSYWYMPFERTARITVEHQGAVKVDAFYFNIDVRRLTSIPEQTASFHAQYRQAAPNAGSREPWENNGTASRVKNPSGAENYVILEASGRGHFVGVTHSVLQNQDFWWGEGDEMIFVDGASVPQIIGTGSEDYYTGSWNFLRPFSYAYAGAPLVGGELAGGRSMAYRFHIEDPIPFTKSIRVTMEHGHANYRSDNWYTVAYWYQREPHAAFPHLPSVADRIPRLQPTGGPGNPARP